MLAPGGAAPSLAPGQLGRSGVPKAAADSRESGRGAVSHGRRGHGRRGTRALARRLSASRSAPSPRHGGLWDGGCGGGGVILEGVEDEEDEVIWRVCMTLKKILPHSFSSHSPHLNQISKRCESTGFIRTHVHACKHISFEPAVATVTESPPAGQGSQYEARSLIEFELLLVALLYRLVRFYWANKTTCLNRLPCSMPVALIGFTLLSVANNNLCTWQYLCRRESSICECERTEGEDVR